MPCFEPQRCVFCGQTFPRLEALTRHVVGLHEEVSLDDEAGGRLRLRVSRENPYPTVLCLCGHGYTCSRESTVLFYEWGPEIAEPNSWTAHLKREGGLERHLGRLRDAALLRRVAGAGRDPDGGRDDLDCGG